MDGHAAGSGRSRSDIPSFAGQICRVCGRALQVIPKGAHLIRAGQTASTVWVIRRGSIVLRRQGINLLLLHGGDVLGDTLVLTGQPAPWDAVALTKSQGATLPAAEFAQLVSGSAALAHSWMLHAAAQVTAHQDRLHELLAGDVTAQVSSLLLHEFDRSGRTSLTQQVIADLLGVQRSSVNRVIRHLETVGVIDGGYGYLHLRDRARMERMAYGRLPVIVDGDS